MHAVHGNVKGTFSFLLHLMIERNANPLTPIWLKNALQQYIQGFRLVVTPSDEALVGARKTGP